MKNLNFADLYHIGIYTDPKTALGNQTLTPEEIICRTLHIAITDGRAASLIVSWVEKYDWIIDEKELYKHYLRITEIKQKIFLCGLLYKINKNKYHQIIDKFYSSTANNIQFSISKVDALKVKTGFVKADSDFIAFGLMTPHFEREDASKFYKIQSVKNIHIQARSKNRTPYFVNSDTILENNFKQKVTHPIEIDSALEALGLIRTEHAIMNFKLPEEQFVVLMSAAVKNSDLKNKINLWYSAHKDILRPLLIKKLIKENNLSDCFNFISKKVISKSTDRIISLKDLSKINIFIKNRILIGNENRADIASLITVDKSMSPYRIAKRLGIDYETANRNHKNLSLLKEIES